jgi:NADH:ubiquinone oxidoreductase subunit K
VNSLMLLQYFGWAGALVLVIGFYGLLVADNLIRTLIAMEILSKVVVLAIILAGYATNQMGLAQALAITLIIIEVALTTVAVGVVLCIFKRTKTLDVSAIRNIKG